MYKIEEESNYETVLECLSLGEQHYEEVEQKSTDIPFKLNAPVFKLMVDNGIIHLVTARDESGKIVGYYCTTVSPDLFSREWAAKEIGIFVDKEHRKGMLFHRLMKKVESILATNGVKLNYIMFKHGHNEKLPLRIGYRATETVYEKVMGV